MPSPSPRHRISLATATSIVVANMIGTGVFTSLGFQVAGVRSGFALLSLWFVGGLFALCGALAYGELAAALPRSGGEFHFLSRIYHPALGFVAGWISLTAGFAAPIALAAMAFGQYASRVITTVSPLALSCTVVLLVTAAHLRDLRLGSVFQNLFTLLKVALVLVFVVAALTVDNPTRISFRPTTEAFQAMVSSPFFISLLFVMYAYAGWNAATYILEEVERPAVNVPRALVLGTALVTLLYLGVNWAFLHATPIDELSGQLEVGHLAAERIFGLRGGQLMSGLLSIALVSAISAMVWTGPRVTRAMGQDYRLFRRLARTNQRGIPVLAILLQSSLVILLLVTSSFQAVLIYTQMVLVASSLLTVLGVFVLRRREPDLARPYRTWGYPWTPLLFALISIATMLYTLVQQPWESLAGLVTVLLGLPLYAVSRRLTDSTTVDPRPGQETADDAATGIEVDLETDLETGETLAPRA